MKDLTRTEQLNNTIRTLKIKKKNAFLQELINNKILVVNCGRFIKFAVIDLNQLKKNAKQFVNTKEELAEKITLSFKDLKIEFKPEVEIFRIMGTGNEDHIQIIAKDIIRQLVICVTWDIA
jgi:acetate kinase